MKDLTVFVLGGLLVLALICLLAYALFDTTDTMKELNKFCWSKGYTYADMDSAYAQRNPVAVCIKLRDGIVIEKKQIGELQ